MKSTKILNGNLINIEDGLIYKTDSNQYIKIFKINDRIACQFLSPEEAKYYQEIDIEDNLIYKTDSNQYIKIFEINGRTACRFLSSEEVRYYQEKEINQIIFGSTIGKVVYSKVRKKDY